LPVASHGSRAANRREHVIDGRHLRPLGDRRNRLDARDVVRSIRDEREQSRAVRTRADSSRPGARRNSAAAIFESPAFSFWKPFKEWHEAELRLGVAAIAAHRAGSSARPRKYWRIRRRRAVVIERERLGVELAAQ
jgi:hypothetical protein